MFTEKLPSFDEIPFFSANFIFSFGKKWNMEHPSKMQLMSCSKPLLKWSNFLLKWHLLSISLYQSNADIIGFENTKDSTEMWLRILQICGWGFYKKKMMILQRCSWRSVPSPTGDPITSKPLSITFIHHNSKPIECQYKER